MSSGNPPSGPFPVSSGVRVRKPRARRGRADVYERSRPVENFELALRIAAFVGIGLFLWSAASSLEQIARGLSKLSERGLYVVRGDADPGLEQIAQALTKLAERGRPLSGVMKEEPP